MMWTDDFILTYPEASQKPEKNHTGEDHKQLSVSGLIVLMRHGFIVDRGQDPCPFDLSINI